LLLCVRAETVVARGLCDVVLSDNLETLDLVVGGAAPVEALVLAG
jgi:hypothetical protein